MRRKVIGCLAGCIALIHGLPSRGAAQFAVCNQTFDVINVALGAYERAAFNTSGWWTIGPNQCANVIDEVLTSRYFYVFAQDVFGREVLTGATPMCVAPDRFKITGEADCLVRGLIEARFHEVDTRKSERWTFFIYPPAK
ncbi:DUF1036 domain-containing protein [Sulfitobacter geojensis]|uniref:DUF1036 domain-containing protein n=1 Tax=Sulfitobacter geojensis TaxID=1342299 RepID=A0AAE2W1V1_9RHOB|nr:DUF1036 domain-containing protein [Sulfitobacter geojensis]MBM1691263.1 DUF1036 domain-containing protein [Sulfitobacter geojensis]MBM1695414.1 DUF1036 domain-containing protein [Sulfitobacter geojensis]MBM1707514.1 DUF1036 domain-containing protein [Sulfitobacter geojensis]MBM1711579.1 DUF1036 domain-containing protein [Sulfitobacter geojensis]MBM1715554.1 DUF1036 domain-containing protein [Sulfitobacter geojensis]